MTNTLPPPATPCSQHEIAEHLDSLAAVPRDILPDGPARITLVGLATAGHDVYAYQAAGEHGPWNLWLQPLADARDDRNGRIGAGAWALFWDKLLDLITDAGLANAAHTEG